MVYLFRKRKPKHVWGDPATSSINGFTELDKISSISKQFVGQKVPSLQKLQKLYLKPNISTRNDKKANLEPLLTNEITLEINSIQELDYHSDPKNNQELSDIFQQPTSQNQNDCNSSTESDDSNTIEEKDAVNLNNDEMNVKTINDAVLDASSAKEFFSRIEEYYKESYQRVLHIFVDTLQV